MGQVNADCLWLTKEQQKLIDLLNMHLMPLIENIYQNVHYNVYLYVMELPYRFKAFILCAEKLYIINFPNGTYIKNMP